jgi:amino acid adenylation domain-containing protein
VTLKSCIRAVALLDGVRYRQELPVVQEIRVYSRLGAEKMLNQNAMLLNESQIDQILPANERFSNLSEEKRVLLIQRLLAKRAASAGGPTIPRREVKSPCALSFGQELMWILDQLTPGNNAYNAPGVRHAKGILDLPALQRALDAIVERHEILRTTYAQEDGIPVQIIAEEWKIDLPVIDLRGIPETERSAEAHRLIVEEAQRPFDLARDLMVRVMLVRLADDEHLMLFAMHHIATDGWSKEVMYRELATLYSAFSTVQPSPLPAPSIQYADFALWQRRWLTGDRLERLLSFWRKTLADALPILALPTDRPRPAVQTVRGAHKRFAIARAVADGLKSLSQREGVTLYMVLLAAFKTFLHRYTTQTDILVGSPVAARNLGDLEGLIGYFSNTLVMRTDLAGDPPFREVLRRVRETALAAYEHQEMPFEKLVVELRPERDLSHTPLVQVAFILHSRALGQALEVPGLTLGAVEIDRGTAKFDLSLSMIDVDGNLFGSCEYNTDLFDEATIIRMQEQFRTLLEGIVENEDRRISILPLLPGGERRRVLSDWNATATEYPHDRCAHELFEVQAERTPDAPAVAFEDVVLTYRELNERANQLAHSLRARGVGLESPVGICMESTLDMPVGILGILKAGGAYVPLDPAYPQDRLGQMIRDSGISLLLTQQSLVTKLPAEDVDVLCQDLARESIAEESRENPQSRATPGNLAYVFFTSGSTGQPRSILVPHGGMVNHNTAATRLYGLGAEDRVLQFASISFDISVEELFPTWFAGATLVLKPASLSIVGVPFARWLDQAKISVLNLPTAYWAEWVHELSISHEPLPRALRQVIVGGEKATTTAFASWQQLAGGRVRWVNTYGPTEATVIATAYSPPAFLGEVGTITELPIGRPIANVQVYILDSMLQPVPIGVPGELYIGGVGVARGYGNQPEATAARFVPDPFGARPGARLFRTGDSARWRPDGNLEFIGRIDNQVKIRGFRIEPGEVETTLERHPGVQEAVVLAREDRPGSLELVAYVVPAARQSVSVKALREYTESVLPPYMVPAAIVMLDALPLTPNGKLDRRALPAPDRTEGHRTETCIAPRTPLEELLAGIWAEVLQLPKIGINENFFELGGHSLLVLRLWSRIEKAFGQNYPVNLIYQSRTIEQLAAALEQCDRGRASSALPAITSEDAGPVPLLFCPDLVSLVGKHLDDIPVYSLDFFFEHEDKDWNSVEERAEFCVGQLRRIRKQGPYQLGGCCANGLILLEVARQLREQGEEVPLLILIDPKRAGPVRFPLNLRLRFLANRVYHHLTHLATAPMASWAKYCRERLWWLYARLIFRFGGVRLKTNHPDALGSKPRYQRALASYIPAVYPGPVTVFFASTRVQKYGNSEFGWKRVARDGLDVRVLPGNHKTLGNESTSRIMAEEIRSCIRGLSSPLRSPEYEPAYS